MEGLAALDPQKCTNVDGSKRIDVKLCDFGGASKTVICGAWNGNIFSFGRAIRITLAVFRGTLHCGQHCIFVAMQICARHLA